MHGKQFSGISRELFLLRREKGDCRVSRDIYLLIATALRCCCWRLEEGLSWASTLSFFTFFF